MVRRVTPLFPLAILRRIFPIAVVLIFGYLGFTFFSKTPEEEAPERPPPALPVVDILPLSPTEHTITVRTRGAVRPRTVTPLSPEVAGRITEVTSAFRPGSFFQTGDLLLTIDPLDYETALAVSRADVASAQATLQDETARAAQAIDDWKRLGRSGTPPPLLARTPQLAGASATLQSAQARLRQAERNLERTALRAPYSGRVLEQNADVGQAVSLTTVVATIFSTEAAEIRLPLTGEELTLIDVASRPEVTLTGPGGSFAGTWQGTIVRTEGSLDEQTRQLFVIAEIPAPFATKPPIEIGLFLEATINGRTLKNVYVFPASAIRASGEIILVTQENTLLRQEVTPLWIGTEHVVISADSIPQDTSLCLTPLAFPITGTKVSPITSSAASR